MLRKCIRCYSIKNIPVQTQPKNKYNEARSRFNLKPVPLQGLVHNPLVSLPSPNNTPRLFLPENDPRVKVLELKFKKYSPDEINDMPLIYGMPKEKTYNITPDVAKEILRLRNEDPNNWTVRKLAQKFGISVSAANVLSGYNKSRYHEIQKELDEVKKTWSEKKSVSRNDRRKRVQLWLRNEY